MSHFRQQLRFVERPTCRARPIPKDTWLQHKEELCSLYQRMTLEELMEHMKKKHNFEASSRQYIYKFELWKVKKYSTNGRDVPRISDRSGRFQTPLSVSAPETSVSQQPSQPLIPPKRPNSKGSVQGGHGSNKSVDRPTVPPKKRQKIAEYMAHRDPFADPSTPHDPGSGQGGSSFMTAEPTSVRRLATLGLQFASTGQPYPSPTSPIRQRIDDRSLHEHPAGNIDASTDSIVPGIDDESNWSIFRNHSDTQALLADELYEEDKIDRGQQPMHSNSRRCFDSSRPIHTFSQEELGDMKMAAHFLRSLGFDSDAFELFTVLLKHHMEPHIHQSWEKASALMDCARSSFLSSQIDIARSELSKALEEPREMLTDIEQFVHRMLLAETYTRVDDDETGDCLHEVTIGCELVNDKMLDQLPNNHRDYDLMTYHYLNKCLEYLNTFVRDPVDSGSVFADKEHLQIRVLERIPGPFELRRGSFQNPCLTSCLGWCRSQLLRLTRLPHGWSDLRSNDADYAYWTDHIGLYCGLWDCWHTQRRDCLGTPLDHWMSYSERSMGIHPAELLSIVCGMIMLTAPPRARGTDIIGRARDGLAAVRQLPDRDIGCRFLDTSDLLRTWLGAAPQRQFHDAVSFFATFVHANQEREAYAERARAFARQYIETDLSIILPNIQRDVQPLSRRESNRLTQFLSRVGMDSMESAATFIPTLVSSVHSSDLSAMRLLKEQIHTKCSLGSYSLLNRVNSAAQDSARTVGELSQAMASSLSLTPSQKANNALLDTMASMSTAISHGNLRLFLSGQAPTDPFADPDLQVGNT
ncbi:hypothetical protein K491DRAFT_774348 [Lophiostoma macrostomum CBS 122681]|uniref:Clr5 domain-containing protein n=1 Tax=Lophiostoma macrostomum CBS 122681 TaxID=1314788 RepID=A0A6A6TNL6_9PLEO|nr:hypothetical protein K491DRAFT_774348 [Lophiostoma macrostomum CBS 122681]